MKVTLAFLLLGVVAIAGVFGGPTPREQRTYIVQASNLPNSDKRDGNSALDTSDPFLKIRDSHLNEIFVSETQENTLSPVFVVPIYVDDAEIYQFEVRDEDDFVNPDDTLGSVLIPATGLVGTHTLANPGGGILIITLLPTESA